MEPELKQKNMFFKKEVEEKEERMLKARKENKRSIWFGLGMFGMIGWSVVVPMLLGIAFGIWLDKKFPGQYSWTITFLFIGLVTGCFIAWHWVSKEHKEMHDTN